MIALNKVDTIDAELTRGAGRGARSGVRRPGAPVSGATGEGVEAVLDAVLGHIGRLAEESRAEEDWTPL